MKSFQQSEPKGRNKKSPMSRLDRIKHRFHRMPLDLKIASGILIYQLGLLVYTFDKMNVVG